MGNSNQTPSSVITIATWALAIAFLGITGTLCAIVIRDGNSALVSQAMGELLWLGGVSFAALMGLLGFTKYLENTSGSASAAAAPGSNALGIVGDIGSILAGLAQQPAASAAAATTSSSTADSTPTLTNVPVVAGVAGQ